MSMTRENSHRPYLNAPLHFERTLHLETMPIDRAFQRCSCTRRVKKSRGWTGQTDRAGTCWERSAEHPPHVQHPHTVKGWSASPPRCCPRRMNQLGVSSSPRADGSGGTDTFLPQSSAPRCCRAQPGLRSGTNARVLCVD